MSVVGIWSGKNILKHAVIETDTMDKPSSGGAGVFVALKTVTHNLGYKPLVRAYYDPDSDGSIFPMIGQNAGISYSSTSPLDSIVPFWFFVFEITETDVTFQTYHTSSVSGTFPFYYRFYRDLEV